MLGYLDYINQHVFYSIRHLLISSLTTSALLMNWKEKRILQSISIKKSHSYFEALQTNCRNRCNIINQMHLDILIIVLT